METKCNVCGWKNEYQESAHFEDLMVLYYTIVRYLQIKFIIFPTFYLFEYHCDKILNVWPRPQSEEVKNTYLLCLIKINQFDFLNDC